MDKEYFFNEDRDSWQTYKMNALSNNAQIPATPSVQAVE